MHFWQILLIIIAVLIILMLVRIIYELKNPKVKSYEIKTCKAEYGSSTKFVFITDLHGWNYGKDNEKLLKMIAEQKPDYILVGGDLIIAHSAKKDETALRFLENLSKIAKVYMAFGNHEKNIETLAWAESDSAVENPAGINPESELNSYSRRYSKLLDTAARNNVEILKNNSVKTEHNIIVTGLDLDMIYYRKIRAEKPNAEDIADYLGKNDENRYNILMAHSPEFFEQYVDHNSDLVLCGHYHGGVIKLPGGRGAISPRMKIFPKYAHGRFNKNGTDMIVSGGCGTHGVNIRLFNRPEVTVITIAGWSEGCENQDK